MRRILIIGSNFEAPTWANWVSQSPNIKFIDLWVVGPSPVNMHHSKIKLMKSHIKPTKENVLVFLENNTVDLVWCMDTKLCVNGLLDELQAKGITVFGATKAWAGLEFYKLTFKEVCAALNICTPAIKITISNAKDFLWDTLSYPVVIKPEFTDCVKTNVYHSAHEVIVGIDPEHTLFKGVLAVEEFIPHTKHIEVIVLFVKNKLISLGTTVEYKSHIGDATNTISTRGHVTASINPSPTVTKQEVNHILEHYIKPFIRHAGEVNGLFCVQMLKDNDGNYHMMEINARPGGPDFVSAWFKNDAGEFFDKIFDDSITQEDIKMLDDDGIYYGLYSIFPLKDKAKINTTTLVCDDYTISDETVLHHMGAYRAMRTDNPLIIAFMGKTTEEVRCKAQNILPTLFTKKEFNYFL